MDTFPLCPQHLVSDMNSELKNICEDRLVLYVFIPSTQEVEAAGFL